ncbi:unnamed protein product [Coregonus sp. 'balchen']|nr:unnamed protein product [Coregonus sp. 'balchen']
MAAGQEPDETSMVTYLSKFDELTPLLALGPPQDAQQMVKERGQWDNKIEFILTVAGANMALGQFTSQGGITCWRKICPLFDGTGYATQVIIIYGCTTYIVILAWAFLYLFSSFTVGLPWANCHNTWITV